MVGTAVVELFFADDSGWHAQSQHSFDLGVKRSGATIFGRKGSGEFFWNYMVAVTAFHGGIVDVGDARLDCCTPSFSGAADQHGFLLFNAIPLDRSKYRIRICHSRPIILSLTEGAPCHPEVRDDLPNLQ